MCAKFTKYASGEGGRVCVRGPSQTNDILANCFRDRGLVVAEFSGIRAPHVWHRFENDEGRRGVSV